MKPTDPTRDPNQGEGDRASAKRYDEHVREYVSEGTMDEDARDAAQWVAHQAREAARAERDGKRGPQPVRRLARPTWLSMHGLVERGQRLLGRLRDAYHRVAHRA
jgi:hypothetical protein